MRQEATLTVSRKGEEKAIAQARSKVGWRASTTKHLANQRPLEQAVEAYRDDCSDGTRRCSSQRLSLVPRSFLYTTR